MIGSDRDVGRMVAQLRGERTQQAVANAMRNRGWPWSQATVWSVEKGERPLKLREAAVLALVLGTPVEELVHIEAELVLLSQRLAGVLENIAALQQEIADHTVELAKAKARLRSAEQERVELEASIRIASVELKTSSSVTQPG
jgi:septal ring factor EnvC (AmiA/AmiB activator)